MKIRPVNNLIELFQQWTLTINLPIFLCLFHVQRAVCVFYSVTEMVVLSIECMTKKPNGEFGTFSSGSEHVCTRIRRVCCLITGASFTSWRFVDDVHVEFLLQKRLNFLSRRVVAGNKRLSYLCIIVLVYLWAAGF